MISMRYGGYNVRQMEGFWDYWTRIIIRFWVWGLVGTDRKRRHGSQSFGGRGTLFFHRGAKEGKEG